ncbi:thioesterase II family protein [Mycobacterium sp. SMC-4]|uniref:thioesterase II family protein n=1 Tax=Mycobacterium sp. SMC-4 TaxID=2857059 RepID=UPI003D0464DC
MRSDVTLKPWIKRFPATNPTAPGGILLFPHAGGAAATYRGLATAFSRSGIDAYVMQYPRRAERLAHPAAETVEELARDLFEAGDWAGIGPLQLFGHCLGAVVAFEFARIAESRGVDVRRLWVSASEAPSAVAASPRLPTTDREVLAHMVELGGTDARLLADEDFVELLLMAVLADYEAFNRYSCPPDVRIAADIRTLGGHTDHRIAPDMLLKWRDHTDGEFSCDLFDGGHFYITEQAAAVAELVHGG